VQGKIFIKFVAASQVLIERLLYPSLDLPTYAQTSWTWTAQERKKERGSALQPPKHLANPWLKENTKVDITSVQFDRYWTHFCLKCFIKSCSFLRLKLSPTTTASLKSPSLRTSDGESLLPRPAGLCHPQVE
jgi:hypothetical protein